MLPAKAEKRNASETLSKRLGGSLLGRSARERIASSSRLIEGSTCAQHILCRKSGPQTSIETDRVGTDRREGIDL